MRSHVLASSSSDESEAKDEVVFEGGNIRSLMLFWRQRGVGMESCKSRHQMMIYREISPGTLTRYGDRGGRVT